MRALIVEDQEKLAQSIKIGLEKEGYAADYVLDGDAAERRLSMNHKEYDVAILDLTLPKKSGSEVCREIRAKGITTPVIVLTGKGELENKVELLNVGADDYLTKPFAFEELLARIKALLRRPTQSLPVELKIGDLSLNTVTRRVVRSGREVPSLTLKEFALLEYLMRNANRVLNREQIYDHIWDFAANSFSNVVDVHIKNLREKIDSGHSRKLLETVRGVGYIIKA
ncbi:MAG TPA: response regulator transcription factor [Candidatus Paceibacterota bacterium]|nr:response regulator transcription factor [Candidatus Paceibacterota bacterium]